MSVTLPCKCTVSDAAGTALLRAQLIEAPRRVSPVFIQCSKKCRSFVPLDVVKRWAAADDTLRCYLESVLATVPDHEPREFDAFQYEYDDQGRLRNKISGEPFHFITQIHYDAVGDLIVPHIQKLMKEEYGLVEHLIPCDAAEDEAKGNVFASPDMDTNDGTLLLIIQGSGAVRAGQWARALCINDSIDTGSILPYLKRAKERGWSSVVFNPNQWEDDREIMFDSAFDPSWFLSTKSTPGSRTTKPSRRPIRGSGSPSKHTLYVWNHIASRSPAANIVIVAHSAGGPCTLHLLRHAKEQLLPRLRGVAFTDSVHHLSRSEDPDVRRFIIDNAVNYVTSRDPLDTLVSERGEDGCRRVSAGHIKHEHTSASAISSVFGFLDEKLASSTEGGE